MSQQQAPHEAIDPLRSLNRYEILHLIPHVVDAKRPDVVQSLLSLPSTYSAERLFKSKLPGTYSIAPLQKLQQAYYRLLDSLKGTEARVYEQSAFYRRITEEAETSHFTDCLRAALRSSISMLSNDTFESSFAVSIRCVLILSSLNSVAENIPSSLMLLLVRQGFWNVTEGLAYVDRNPAHENKVPMLRDLLPLIIASGMQTAALEVAKSISDDASRSAALVTLADFLPENERTSEFATAVKHINDYTDTTLNSILPRLVEDGHAQDIWRIAAAKTKDNPALLAAVVPYLTQEQVKEALMRLRKSVAKMKAIVTSLTSQQLRDEVAHSMDDLAKEADYVYSSTVETLVLLIRRLADIGERAFAIQSTRQAFALLMSQSSGSWGHCADFAILMDELGQRDDAVKDVRQVLVKGKNENPKYWDFCADLIPLLAEFGHRDEAIAMMKILPPRRPMEDVWYAVAKVKYGALTGGVVLLALLSVLFIGLIAPVAWLVGKTATLFSSIAMLTFSIKTCRCFALVSAAVASLSFRTTRVLLNWTLLPRLLMSVALVPFRLLFYFGYAAFISSGQMQSSFRFRDRLIIAGLARDSRIRVRNRLYFNMRPYVSDNLENRLKSWRKRKTIREALSLFDCIPDGDPRKREIALWGLQASRDPAEWKLFLPPLCDHDDATIVTLLKSKLLKHNAREGEAPRQMSDQYWTAIVDVEPSYDASSEALAEVAPALPQGILRELLSWQLSHMNTVADSTALSELLVKIGGAVAAHSPETALDLAARIPDERYRADGLSAIAPKLSADLLVKSLDIVDSFGTDGHQFGSLAAISIRFAELGDASRALQLADRVEDARREDALLGVMPYVPQALLQEALRIVCRKTMGGSGRGKIIASFADRLPAHLAARAAWAALRFDEGERPTALANLLPRMDDPLRIVFMKMFAHGKAAEPAVEIALAEERSGGDDVRTIAVQPEAGWRQALEDAIRAGTHSERASILSKLCPELPTSSTEEVRDAWETITDSFLYDRRVDVLRDLTSLVPWLEQISGSTGLCEVAKAAIDCVQWWGKDTRPLW